MIYAFSRNRSDQFSSRFLPGSCQKLSPEVETTGADLILISVRGVTIHLKYGSPRYEAGGSVHGLFLVISVRFTPKKFFERQN